MNDITLTDVLPSAQALSVAPFLTVATFLVWISEPIVESVGILMIMLVVVIVLGHGLDALHAVLKAFYGGDDDE